MKRFIKLDQLSLIRHIDVTVKYMVNLIFMPLFLIENFRAVLNYFKFTYNIFLVSDKTIAIGKVLKVIE